MIPCTIAESIENLSAHVLIDSDEVVHYSVGVWLKVKFAEFRPLFFETVAPCNVNASLKDVGTLLDVLTLFVDVDDFLVCHN